MAIGSGNNIHVLVDESVEVLFTIRGIFLREKLMGVPYKVNIQRRYEKRCRGRRHEIQESIGNVEDRMRFRRGIKTV
jgi:hypothetical protein